MYVTYEEYRGLGYGAVEEEEYARFEAMAESAVRRFTFGRIRDGGMRPGPDADAGEKSRAEMNQRGVCELTELYHERKNCATGEAGTAIQGFSNEGYSETYAGPAEADEAFGARAAGIINAYFTPEQRYRGV